MRRSAPAAPIDICRRCHDAAHGNPWLVGELGHQVASHGPGSLSFPVGSKTPVRALARDVIARRLAALSPARPRRERGPRGARRTCSSPMWWRRSPECHSTRSRAARDALASAGLLGPDAQGLAHALIAAAILENLPRAESERLHREAARTLLRGWGGQRHRRRAPAPVRAAWRPGRRGGTAGRGDQRQSARRASRRRGLPAARARGTSARRRSGSAAGCARGGDLRRGPARGA